MNHRFVIPLEPREVIVLIQHYESLVKTLNESAHLFPEEVREEFRQLVDDYIKRSEEIRMISEVQG